jgi:hypothetical protein
MRNTNTTIARNADDVCFRVFKPTTYDCGLDQLVPGQAVFKKGKPEPTVMTNQTPVA